MNKLLKASIMISGIIIILILMGWGMRKSTVFDTSNNLVLKKIYLADNISLAQQTIIDLFNETYKNRIEVVAVDLPFTKFSTNERKEILARTLRSKNERIDIFAIDLIWGPRFAKWSHPLDEYFSDDQLSEYFEHALKSCFYEGQLIALPFFTDVGLLYFRRDILEQNGFSKTEIEQIKTGISWPELLKIGNRLKNTSHPFYIYAADSFEGMICTFFETLPTSNIDEYFMKEQVDLENPASRKGLQFMVDLIYKYKFTPPQVLLFDDTKTRDYGLTNNAVFMRGWPGFFSNTEELSKHQDIIKHIEGAPLPYFEGSKKSAVFGGWNLMISKFSKNKKASAEFLKFTANPEIQKILYEKNGSFPVLKSVFEDSVFVNKYSELKYFHKILMNGKHRPYRENYTKISDIMSFYFHKALLHEITVNEALSIATEKINSRQVFIK